MNCRCRDYPYDGSIDLFHRCVEHDVSVTTTGGPDGPEREVAEGADVGGRKRVPGFGLRADQNLALDCAGSGGFCLGNGTIHRTEHERAAEYHQEQHDDESEAASIPPHRHDIRGRHLLRMATVTVAESATSGAASSGNRTGR